MKFRFFRVTCAFTVNFFHSEQLPTIKSLQSASAPYPQPISNNAGRQVDLAFLQRGVTFTLSTSAISSLRVTPPRRRAPQNWSAPGEWSSRGISHRSRRRGGGGHSIPSFLSHALFTTPDAGPRASPLEIGGPENAHRAGRCSLACLGSHPTAYLQIPSDDEKAEARRAERWEAWPHSIGQTQYIPRIDFPPEGKPTLNLRRDPAQTL
jgi:hypothetical protein